MIELEENARFLSNLKEKLININKTLKIDELKKEISDLEKETLKADFWSNIDESSIIFSKLKKLQKKVQIFDNLKQELSSLTEMNELLLIELDEELAKDLLRTSKKLSADLEKLEIETLLSGKYDTNNAIITLHPGAGGTESQDWVQMLYRMYG
ncbi:MAG: PCRF domain-containing protein, partial [Clostridia bacterium]|nr:PCRF domain-containing protein [Clostridia bacterium]